MHKIPPFVNTPIIYSMPLNIFITGSLFLCLTQVLNRIIFFDFAMVSHFFLKGIIGSTFSLKLENNQEEKQEKGIGNDALKNIYTF